MASATRRRRADVAQARLADTAHGSMRKSLVEVVEAGRAGRACRRPASASRDRGRARPATRCRPGRPGGSSRGRRSRHRSPRWLVRRPDGRRLPPGRRRGCRPASPAPSRLLDSGRRRAGSNGGSGGSGGSPRLARRSARRERRSRRLRARLGAPERGRRSRGSVADSRRRPSSAASVRRRARFGELERRPRGIGGVRPARRRLRGSAASRSSVSAASTRSPEIASSARPGRAARPRPGRALQRRVVGGERLGGLADRSRTPPMPTKGRARSGASAPPRRTPRAPRRGASGGRPLPPPEGVLVALVEGVAHPLVRPEQLDQQRLLHVQPVLGLVEDQAPRAVHDGRGDLLAAVGRQAVHRHRVGPGGVEQRVVDPVARRTRRAAPPPRPPGPSTSRRPCRRSSAPRTISVGSSPNTSRPPVAAASSWARATIRSFGP